MTARRILYFVTYGLVLLFCLATGSRVLWFAFAVMTAMLLLSGLSLLLVRLRFSVEEHAEPREIEAGGKGSLSILMKNPYIFPFPQLEAEYLLPGPNGGTVYVASFTVLPLQRIRIHEDLVLPCRGVYPIGLKTVILYDMFGLFCLRLPFDRLAKSPMPTLTVLPRLRPLPRVGLPVMESPVNTSGSARATEDTSSPADSRDYRPGDPVKRIHWKLSARQGHLMIKTYEPAAVSDALLYLDTDCQIADPKEAWYAGDVMTGAAVSLAGAILGSGVPVRVIYLKDRRIEHRLTDLNELPSLRQELAALELSGGRSLRRLLSHESGPLNGARCGYVLTTGLNGSAVDLISTLASAGIDLTVGLCRGTHDAPDEATDALYAQLERKQIPISLLVPCENPAAALAALL